MNNRLKQAITVLLSLCISFSFNVIAYATENQEVEIISVELDQDLEPVEPREPQVPTSRSTKNVNMEITDVSILETYSTEEREDNIIESDSAIMYEKNEDEIIVTTELQTVSASTDLVIRNLVASNSQPFSVGVSTPFTFYIDNYGTTDFSNVPISVYVSGTYLGIANTQSIPAGTGKKIQLSLTSANDGMHTLQLVANKDRTISESNYDNNSVYGTYRWIGNTGLCAYSFYHSGSTPIPTNSPEQFKFSVANFGDSTVTNVKVDIYIGSSRASRITLDRAIPPGYATGGTITIGFPKVGTKVLKMVVDPEMEFNDQYRQDNIEEIRIEVTDTARQTYTRKFDDDYSAAFYSSNGWSAISGSMKWYEEYYINGDQMYLDYRIAYAYATVNRTPDQHSWECLLLPEPGHGNLNSGVINKTFTWKNLGEHFPFNTLMGFSAENDALITYPLDNPYYAILTMQIKENGTVAGGQARLILPLKHQATESGRIEVDALNKNAYQLGILERSISTAADQIVLQGDNIQIYQSELDQLTAQYKAMNVDNAEERSKEELINRKALYQIAVDNGYEASRNEVTAEIEYLLEVINDPDSLNKDFTNQFFEGVGMTPDEYFEDNFDFYKERLTIDKYRASLIDEYAVENNLKSWTLDAQEKIDTYILREVDNFIKQDDLKEF